MEYKVYITYKNQKEEIDIEAPSNYDAAMSGAAEFIKLHPEDRLHDDRRRPYPIPLKPSWLVSNGFVKVRRKVDRRIKY